MFLIQLLVPLSGNDGKAFPDSLLGALHTELAHRFGGLTAYNRAPASGVWAHHGAVAKDDIVMVEVMTASLDREWWAAFTSRWESLLQQEELVVRAIALETL